jgi:hypothetical protein
MTLKLDTPNHELDSEGYLVPLPDETPEAHLLRTATALWEAGLSPNTPEQVMKQFEEPLPPTTREEGQSDEEYEAQQAEWKEEWEHRRQERIEKYNEETKAAWEAKKEAKEAQPEHQPEPEPVEEEESSGRRSRRSRQHE